nr:rhamnolipids biosynthesis 3-oxoacyl-[acyl-carrier-protein] reductase [Quercus suber]
MSLHHARPQRQHAHVSPHQLRPQRVREPLLTRLGRMVDRLAGERRRLQRRRARDVQDRAPARRRHATLVQRDVRHGHEAAHVRVQHWPHGRRQRLLPERLRRAQRDPRVVHDDVQRRHAEGPQRAIDGVRERAAIADGDREDDDARGRMRVRAGDVGRFVRDGVQLVLGARDEDEIGALGGVREGDGAADALATMWKMLRCVLLYVKWEVRKTRRRPTMDAPVISTVWSLRDMVNGIVAVITGGGSGLGLYAARALDRNGAKAVYIVGRRKETLDAAAKTAVNGTIKPIVGDVTDKDSLQRVVAQVKEEQGFVNLLFANAGVIGPTLGGLFGKKTEKPSIQEMQAALWKPDMADFTKTSEVNVTGVFYAAVAFLELLDAGNKKRNVPQDSQIIVTSSIAGFSRQVAAGYAYASSKAAITHLVKMLATTFAQNQYRIRANVIAPGFYPSEMTESAMSGMGKFDGVEGHEGMFAGAQAMDVDVCPGGRSGSEQDFAGTVLFMASPAGAYLNGNTMVTDGGRLSQLPASY